jgi:DNA-binding beta-propeller fold protein YncE
MPHAPDCLEQDRHVRHKIVPLLAGLIVAAAAIAPSAARAGVFDVPAAIAVSGANVYVAEYGAARVDRFDLSGRRLGSFGSPGSGAGELAKPDGVAVSPDGKLVYVSEQGNHRVSVFTRDGAFVRSFGSHYYLPKEGFFERPQAIAVAPNGEVYVSDHNSTIQVFTRDGVFLRWWGRRAEDMHTPAYIQSVVGLAVNADGRVYASDEKTHLLTVFDSQGHSLAAWGPDIGNWLIDRPSGIAAAPGGGVYYLDDYATLGSRSGHEQVVRVSAGGRYAWSFGGPCGVCSLGQGGNDPGDFDAPQGIAVGNGFVFVADTFNDRVQVFTLDGSFVSVWTGSGEDRTPPPADSGIRAHVQPDASGAPGPRPATPPAATPPTPTRPAAPAIRDASHAADIRVAEHLRKAALSRAAYWRHRFARNGRPRATAPLRGWLAFARDYKQPFRLYEPQAFDAMRVRAAALEGRSRLAAR